MSENKPNKEFMRSLWRMFYKSFEEIKKDQDTGKPHHRP